MTDDQEDLSVLPDRSLGGSSINDGQLELMVHRRLLVDDHYGVGEALNETEFGEGLVIRGTHYVLQADPSSSAEWRRIKAAEVFSQPQFLFANTDQSLEDWLGSGSTKSFSGLTREASKNINFVTLETLNGDTVLLRVEHIFQPGEGPLSDQTTLDLAGLFSTFSIDSIQEMTLGGNVPLTEAKRLHWNTNTWGSDHNKYHEMKKVNVDNLKIVLEPMEIKTFLVNVTWH